MEYPFNGVNRSSSMIKSLNCLLKWFIKSYLYYFLGFNNIRWCLSDHGFSYDNRFDLDVLHEINNSIPCLRMATNTLR